MGSSLIIFVGALLGHISSASAEKCYASGDVTGIVFATIIATLVLCAMILLVYWLIWKPHVKAKELSKLVVVEEGNEKYAYDNPYFQEDETSNHNSIKKNDSDLSVKKDPLEQTDGPVNKDKLDNGKVNPLSNLVFTNITKSKPRSLENTFISLEPDVVSVPLRGHDFTGLGFNITGNMRDGIYVKDVLHRGPASESGEVKTGDRILSVTISFSSMVYEDALTILSYASPYDVSLELKKAGRSVLAGHEKKASMSSNDVMNVGMTGNSSSERLYHPLYRSQSIDDLTQIGKDQLTGGLGMNGGIPAKRSLSIGAPVHRMKREQYQTKENLTKEPKLVNKEDENTTKSIKSSASDVSISSKCSSDVVITVSTEVEKLQEKCDNTVVIDVDSGPTSVVIDGLDSIEVPKRGDAEENLDSIEKGAEKKSRKKGKAPQPPQVSGGVTVGKEDSSSSSLSSSDEDETEEEHTKDTPNLDEQIMATAPDESFDLDSLESINDQYKSQVLVSDDSLEDLSKPQELEPTEITLKLEEQSLKEDQDGDQNKTAKRKAPEPPISEDEPLTSEDPNQNDVISVEIPNKSSLSDVETDSLEILNQEDEAEVNDPDSLEIACSTNVILPVSSVRKDSTSSSSSEESTEAQEDKITKIVITAPVITFDSEVFHSESCDEHSASRRSSTSFSSSDDEIKPDEVKNEVLENKKDSSSSSSSDDEEKLENVEEKKKEKTVDDSSSSSSSSDEEQSAENIESRSRKSSSSSSVDVEELILKETKKPVVIEFDLKDESLENSEEQHDSGNDTIEADNTTNDVSNTPIMAERRFFMSSTPMVASTNPPKLEFTENEDKSRQLKNGSTSPPINIPIIPPLISTSKLSPSAFESPSKVEVIEISQQELDDVMMNHEQFIMKQSMVHQSETLDGTLEDSVNGNTTYSSAFETNISIDGTSSKNINEDTKGHTFTVTPAEGAISKTVVITNNKINGDGSEIVKIVSTSIVNDIENIPELKMVE